MPLYRQGLSQWRQAADSGGDVDVAAIEIDVGSLPDSSILHAFGPEHLEPSGDLAEVGDALVIVGFPLGFHDTVHHLRGAKRIHCLGLRRALPAAGLFSDRRPHPSRQQRRPGAAAQHDPDADRSRLPWQLLGVHSTRMDMRTRDLVQDESLGLNCAWYADVLMALTEPAAAAMEV